jgi:CDGSH-type Zn-finger protein
MIPIPDGPLLVRGDLRLVDPDTGGVIAEETRVALCRCGKSKNQPFCDNSHRPQPFSPTRWVLEVLAQVWVEASGTLEGMWDAVGADQAGAIEFVEAKRCQVDRLNKNQHRFAEAATRALGGSVTFTVVEWDFAGDDRGTPMRRS